MTGFTLAVQRVKLLKVSVITLLTCTLLHVLLVESTGARTTDAVNMKRLVARLMVTSRHQEQHTPRDVEGCGSEEAECPGGKCIPLAYLCDGVADCAGSWDEKPVVCKRHPCEQGWVHCPGSYTCIQADWMCDREEDCPGGRDETKKACNSAGTAESCPKGKYPCHKGGGCLDPRHFCDGDFDCLDKSDEVPELCLLVPCPEGTSRCLGSTECITTEWECDGEPDCQNGADESHELCVNKVCGDERVKCETATGSYLCLWQDFLCDGEAHCKHGWDEQPEHCVQVTCSEGEVTCDDLSCVPIHAYCRGWQTCPDGSTPDAAICDDFYANFYRRNQKEQQTRPSGNKETHGTDDEDILNILRELLKKESH